jgi:hypothetical protein
VRDRGMETMPGLDVRLGKERPRNRARVSTRARCIQSSKGQGRRTYRRPRGVAAWQPAQQREQRGTRVRLRLRLLHGRLSRVALKHAHGRLDNLAAVRALALGVEDLLDVLALVVVLVAVVASSRSCW